MTLGVQQLAVALIDDRESIQSRAEVSPVTVAEYSEAMAEGAEFPPITVFFDGQTYRIADGLHRYAAVIDRGGTEIAADVRTGGRFEALLHAVGANATHGLHRSNRDKARAVELLLDEPGCSAWSDRQIAKKCGVSHTMVANARRLRGGNGCQPDEVRTGNERRSLPTRNRQPMATVATPAPVESGVAPRVDGDVQLAARLEERIATLTNDVCAAPVRVRMLLTPALDAALPRLARARSETAA